MKKALEAVAAAALLATAQAAWATPSTVYWTPATTYTQPYLVPHLTYDTYVAEGGMLPNDYGLTIGVLPDTVLGGKLQAEVGADLFTPGKHKDNFYLNGKVALVEGAYGKWQPGVSAGIQSIGFKKDYSDVYTFHAEASKNTPYGAFGAGFYFGLGSKTAWSGSDGVRRLGLMGSYVSPDLVIGRPGLDKINFTADLATGKNAMGAVGGGVALYFTPAIDVITGPVWFLDSKGAKSLYGSDFMWTVQLDVDVDLVKPAKK